MNITRLVCGWFGALAVGTAFAGYPDDIQADQPVGYWRLGEAAEPPPAIAANAGSLGDAAQGSYLNGVLAGQAGAIAGDSNTAAGVDGVDDKIEIPFLAGLNPQVFTIECWAKVRAGSSGYRSPLSSRDDTPAGNTQGYIFYATPANQWEFWTGQGGGWGIQGGAEVVEEDWAHLVGTYDGQHKRFYVNGALVSVAAVAVVPNGARPLRIGAGRNEIATGEYYFAGDVDEVAVYDTVLSPARVYAHYFAGGRGDPVPVFPAVVGEPQPGDYFIGQRIELRVVATGSLPLQYQWKRDGVDVAGATSETLVIESAKLTDGGIYTVEVTNAGGSVLSGEALVNVLNITIPVIEQPPHAVTAYSGGSPRFSVVASGSANLTYQWQFGAADLPNETNATLVLRGVTTAQQGSYRVRVTSEAGSTLSEAAQLTVVALPANSYAGVVMADTPVAFWRLGETEGETALDLAGGINGTYLNGVALGTTGAIVDDADKAASFVADSQTKVEVGFNPALNTTAFTVEAWAKVTGGQGVHRSPLTSRDDGPQRGFIFYATPGDQWEFWTGTGAQVGWNTLAGPSVVYDQWTHLVATYDGTTKRFYVNGNEVGNNTSAYGVNTVRPLRIGAGATDADPGNFFFYGDIDEVAVYDKALSPDRVMAHYGAGLGATTVPSITTQPISQAVLPGETVTFTVQASGSLPLNYQWQYNGVDLPGETAPTLTLANVQTANAGKYRAVVRNLPGSVTSSEATLAVVIAPDQPYPALVLADSPVGYWRLGETEGEVATDAVADRDGAYLNGVTLGQPGAIAEDVDLAAGFAAASQTKVDVPYAMELNAPVFSIEAWAMVTGGANNYRSPVTSRADLPQRGYIFYAAANNNWEFWSGKGDQSGWDNLSGPAVALGQWVHLVGTYDGTTKRFFVNGKQVGARDVLFGPNDENPLRIGGGATESDGNYFFAGSVDEVAYYDKALTPERILVHYARGAKKAEPPTLTLEKVDGGIKVTWSAGTLEEATNVTGAWTTLPGTSPLTIPATGERKFIRARQ